MLLRVLRHPAWSLSPYTSSRTSLAAEVCSTNNCRSRGRFFKYRPRRFKLVIDCSVGLCMSLANCFVEHDKSGRSCDKYAALTTTLRYCLVCNASNCGDVINTSPSLFLTDGVVTPFALSRFNDCAINSACRGSGSYSIQLLSPSEFQRTYRFRILTSLASSSRVESTDKSSGCDTVLREPSEAVRSSAPAAAASSSAPAVASSSSAAAERFRSDEVPDHDVKRVR